MLYHGQRNLPKRFEASFSRWLVGHLFLVFRVQTGEFGLIGVERLPQDTLHHREYPHAERQQGREALDVVVQRDKQRALGTRLLRRLKRRLTR